MRLAAMIVHAAFDAGRRAQLPRLLRALGRRPDVYVGIAGDPDRRGPWATAEKALLEALRARPTHILLLQDDVIPCRGLLGAARRIAALLPDNPVSFYCAYPEAAAVAAGIRWIRTGGNGAWTLGLLLPAHHVGPLLAWQREYVDPKVIHDDLRISAYYLNVGARVYLTVPSLVDHGGAGRSLVGHNNAKGPQVAASFLGAGADASAIDWAEGLDRPIEIEPRMAVVRTFSRNGWFIKKPTWGGHG